MARILIVDDAAISRRVLAQMLEGVHEVCGEAGNGAEAVEMYRRLRPDIVTMDVTMPDMSGTEAVKRIIAFDPGATILMCSAMGQRHVVLEALQSGAKDFLVKPFQRESILDAIARWL